MKNIKQLVSKDCVVRIDDRNDLNSYSIHNCTVWFTPAGEIYSVEPYVWLSHGSRHYFNSISGDELQYIEICGDL